MEAVDLYCERIGPALWAEPLNAITNGAFLVVAWLVWRLARDTGGPDAETGLLIGLLAAIGTGSGLFHTFANTLTRWLDVVPIALFTLAYAWIYCRRILGLSAGTVLGLVAAAGLAIIVSRQFPGVLNGSLKYAPAFSLAVGLGTLHVMQGRRERYSLLAAAGVILVALFFRSVDMAACSQFPFGTHFLWHLFAALAFYFAARGLIANRAIAEPLIPSGGCNNALDS